MKIVIASGKGGVGKSMLASSLAILFSNEGKVVACDCDVDAPNMGLWLGVDDYDSKEIISTSEKAIIDYEKCDSCGMCEKICRFSAISKNSQGNFVVSPFLCEGCGACKIVCPNGAIRLEKVDNGELMVKKMDKFPLVSAQLYPGESGSGKIVELLRERAMEFDSDYMIMDSAAGIGCPVIASIRGTDFAVLVTEPTPSGFSDLKRILEIINHFRIPYVVVINKWDINKETSKDIEEWAGDKIIGKIGYDKKVVDSIVNLKPVLSSDSAATKDIRKVYAALRKRIRYLDG